MSVKKFLKDAQKIQDQLHRKKEEPKPVAEEGEGNWLVSYADMMTLLCGFFVMMFSMAKLDDNKYEKVKEAMAKSFGVEYNGPASSELGKFLTSVLNETGIDKDATIRSDATGVSVAFQSTLFFDTLSAELKPQGRIVMDRLIEAIATRQVAEQKQYRVVVEGHTDSRPIVGGTFPSNWELSSARAARVVRMFLARGFTPERLTAIGYGETRPLAEGRTPAGLWDEGGLAKNRRVVVRILEPSVDSIPFPENKALDDAKPLTGPAGMSMPVPPAPVTPAAAAATSAH